VEVREPIELSFGVVSGVSGGTGVLDGSTFPKGKGQFREGVTPIGFNGIFV